MQLAIAGTDHFTLKPAICFTHMMIAFSGYALKLLAYEEDVKGKCSHKTYSGYEGSPLSNETVAVMKEIYALETLQFHEQKMAEQNDTETYVYFSDLQGTGYKRLDAPSCSRSCCFKSRRPMTSRQLAAHV